MLKTSSITEQVAAHLREELYRGRWTGSIPGRDRLAKELGASKSTMDRALKLLEQEGILQSQGTGKGRKIILQKKYRKSAMRVTMILYEFEDSMHRYISEMRHRLNLSGHDLTFAPQTFVELKRDPKRVAKMVKESPADAWIILAGSQPLLEWFSQLPIPAFALFGRMTDIPIAGAGPDHRPAMREAVQRLIDLGHRRIVMLVREERRKPNYGGSESLFLNLLSTNGPPSGSYNIPDWEESREGLTKCLDQLFQITPPTALIVGDSVLFLSVYNYLAQKKGDIFNQIALVCTDYSPSFKWCSPSITHFKWEYQATVHRAVRWVDKVARHKQDLKQHLTPAKLIGGESLPCLHSKG